jgi:predicted Zn-dependent protease
MRLARERPKEAISFLRAALAHRPESPVVLSILGVALTASDQLDEDDRDL